MCESVCLCVSLCVCVCVCVCVYGAPKLCNNTLSTSIHTPSNVYKVLQELGQTHNTNPTTYVANEVKTCTGRVSSYPLSVRKLIIASLAMHWRESSPLRPASPRGVQNCFNSLTCLTRLFQTTRLSASLSPKLNFLSKRVPWYGFTRHFFRPMSQ